MKPELRAPKPPPVTAVTFSIAGSARTMLHELRHLRLHRLEGGRLVGADEATMRPVSCCGTKPFGIAT
jgi:hypothetical protein